MASTSPGFTPPATASWSAAARAGSVSAQALSTAAARSWAARVSARSRTTYADELRNHLGPDLHESEV